MYHYVRDLKNTRFPDIKGLDSELFVEQIEFLNKHYNFVGIEDLIDCYQGKAELPSHAALLTFDDGYADHFHTVFPVLDHNKIQGCFYIPVQTVVENTILDVNKIHYILAASKDDQQLYTEVLSLLDDYRSEYDLQSNAYYIDKLAVANRFDSKEVIFIKRLLQVELDEELRGKITTYLFHKYVSSDEKAFSCELYMNERQIQHMQRNGMHIGGHGYSHYWLGSLDREKQAHEIRKSKEFVERIGGDLDCWSFCYPYGDYNQDTLDILKLEGCKLGFTTAVDILNAEEHECLTVPRLDTNDLPKDRAAAVNKWYLASDQKNAIPL